MDATQRIFRALKQAGRPLAFTEILDRSLAVQSDYAEFEDHLLANLDRGLISRDEAGRYSIKYWLDPPIQPETLHKDYEIRLAMEQAGVTGPTARKHLNPLRQYLPHLDQNGRGTCVGHGGAYLATQNYLQVTEDYPQPDEIAALERDVRLNLGYPCKVVFDRLYRTVFSPQWLYNVTRIIGHVTAPSGSWTQLIPQALREVGAVPWDECLTPKTTDCAPLWPREKAPLGKTDAETYEQLKEIASGHRVEGTAKATTFEEVCYLIEKYGGVVMPINIYDNWMANGGKGLLPDPQGDVIGGHCMFWDGYDLDKREIYGRHSWRGMWTAETGISERYYKKAAGPAWAVIDSEETRLLREQYCLVSISSTVPARYAITGDGKLQEYTEDPLKVALEKGQPYEITAHALDPESVVAPSLRGQFTFVSDRSEVRFEFVRKPGGGGLPPKPPAGWLDGLMELLRRILGRGKGG